MKILKYFKRISRTKIFIFAIFLINLSVRFVIGYFLQIAGFHNASDISSDRNLLHYTSKYVIFSGRFVQLIVSCVEEFLNRKIVEKSHVEAEKINEIFKREFFMEISYKTLKKIKRRRKIFAVLEMIFHEGIFLIKSVRNLTQFLQFSMRSTRTLINCLIICRFCNYVDFTNIHLKALKDVLNSRNIKNLSDEKLKVKKILAVRKCYIHVINIKDQLAKAMRWTMSIYFIVILLSILRRCYKIYKIIIGDLPISQLFCK